MKTKILTTILTIGIFLSMSSPLWAILSCTADLKTAPTSIPLYKVKPSPILNASKQRKTLKLIEYINPRDPKFSYRVGFIYYIEGNLDELELVLFVYNLKENLSLGFVRNNDIKFNCGGF